MSRWTTKKVFFVRYTIGYLLCAGLILLNRGCSSKGEKRLIAISEQPSVIKEIKKPSWLQYRSKGLFLQRVVEEPFKTTTPKPIVSIPATSDNEKTTTEHVMTVVSPQLNVRSGPGTDHSVVNRLNKGEKVIILEVEGNWGRVGVNQYVSIRYLRSAGKKP